MRNDREGNRKQLFFYLGNCERIVQSGPKISRETINNISGGV